MTVYRLLVLSSSLIFAVSIAPHVASHSLKGDRSDDSAPVAQINVQISLGGNTTTGVLASKNKLGIKGEKGERGKAGPPGRGEKGDGGIAGPPGRPAADSKCSCNCCSRLDKIEEKLVNMNLMVEQLRKEKSITSYRSCQEAKQLGETASGVYTLDLGDGLNAFQVYCDMSTDGGGWTVFQRRQDGSIDFYRDWSQYKNGFGDLNGEFWLGLDKIHRLTKQQRLLRVDLMDFGGSRVYAQYKGFQIGDENSKYTMTFTSYSGNAGNALVHHKGAKFTTKDKDNDRHSAVNCALNHKGGWWYGACFHANLNGQYFPDGKSDGKAVAWYEWKNSYTSLKFTEMKLR